MASQQSRINMPLGATISDCGDADLGDTELKLEQEYAINFMVRDYVKPGDIVKKISVVYGDKAISRSQLYNLISQVSHGVSAATHKAGSGRPSSAVTDENKERVRAIIDSNLILICHC